MTNRHIFISELKQQHLSIGILASAWCEFNQKLEVLKKYQADILHFDVADGHFSSLFTVGSIAIKQFSQDYFKDVHLMVNNQRQVAEDCVKNGANLVTLQLENKKELQETIQWLKKQSNAYKDNYFPVLVGLSLCPDTELSLLAEYIDEIDVIQLLTLDPRSGQKFDAEFMSQRIEKLQSLFGIELQEKLLSIDGSMTLSLAEFLLQKHNINWVVSGSALFSHDFETTLENWRGRLSSYYINP